MKYKCIIADEEPQTIKTLRNYVESLESLEIIGICNNALQIMEILTKEKIDLMFLDLKILQIQEHELLKTIQFPTKIIFTTSQQSYSIKTIDPGVIDFLQKPVLFERFLQAVIKFCHNASLEKGHSPINPPDFVYFRAERKMVKVILEDITYIESFKDYIIIHRQIGDNLKVKYSISSIENMLPHELFLRIHRSFIVSIKKVTAFTNNDVEIEKVKLPIGRSYPYVFKRLTCDNSFIAE